MSEITRLQRPAQVSGLHLRREILFIAYAGMEASWLTPFFMLLVPPARTGSSLLTILLFAVLILAFHTWSRVAERFQIGLRWERLVMLLALPVLILLGWRLYLHPGLAPLDFGWIPAAGYGMIANGSGGYWIILVTVLFLWWRGIALSRREFTFESVSFTFRFGLLLLVVGTSILSLVAGLPVLIFVFAFFFFSLLAVALTRLEEVGQVKGYVGQLFDFYWLAMLMGTVGLVLLAGAALVWLARPEGIENMRRLWAPIGDWLINALLWLVTIILAPFEPFLQWLASVAVRGWEILLEGPFGQTVQDLSGTIPQEETVTTGSELFDMALMALRLVCGAGLVLAILLGGLALLNQERRRLREQAETHEDLDASLGDALAGLLRNARNRLRNATALVTQFGVGSDLLAAISVRNIYANTTRLARKRGYPRHKARTAYEYLPDLQAAFPQAAAEAQAITDAYVAVAYGDLPTSREEMAALRAAYERLRNSPAQESKA